MWTSDPLAALPNPMSSRFDAMPIPFAPGACQAEPCLAGVTPQQYVAAVDTPNAAGAASRSSLYACLPAITPTHLYLEYTHPIARLCTSPLLAV